MKHDFYLWCFLNLCHAPPPSGPALGLTQCVSFSWSVPLKLCSHALWCPLITENMMQCRIHQMADTNGAWRLLTSNGVCWVPSNCSSFWWKNCPTCHAFLSVKYDGVCNGGSPDGDFDAGMNTTLLYRLSLHDVCLIYFHISNTFTEGHVLYCAFKKTPPRFIWCSNFLQPRQNMAAYVMKQNV